MRSRLLASMSALALTLGGLLVSASPAAAADPAHCKYWGTPADEYSAGGIDFRDGTAIRTGPYTDCAIVGRGYPSQGIDVHCFVTNSNGAHWVYVRNLSTGKAGWSRDDALQASPSTPAIPRCY